MKKQKSITQFTVAADNPVALHNGSSNDWPIAAASSSVNLFNDVFEKPYQPDQTYRFPKGLFGKILRPFQSACFTLYSWLHYQPLSDTVICYICAKHNRNGDLNSITNKDPALISTGFCNSNKAIECFEVHRMSKCHKTSLAYEKMIPKRKDARVMFNSDTERKRESQKKIF